MPSRIIISSSAAHAMAPKGGIDYASLSKGGLSPSVEYGQSKWGNIAMARTLHERYPDITSVSVHPGEGMTQERAEPGSVASNLTAHFSLTGWVLNWVPWLIVRVPIIAADSAHHKQTRIGWRGEPAVGSHYERRYWRAVYRPVPAYRTLSTRYIKRKSSSAVGLVRGAGTEIQVEQISLMRCVIAANTSLACSRFLSFSS